MRPILIAVLACVAAAAVASDAKPRTGIFQLTFDERHPESAYERMLIRFDGRLNPKADAEALYRIQDEPFDVHVPETYDGSAAFGLVVHIDAGATGNPYVYKDVMAPLRLIWVGSQKSQNERHIVPRYGLAVDAVHNMVKRYRIDPKRIYVCGMSGGGRCASMIAPAYSDVFTGGIYLVGCNPPQLPDDKKVGKPIRELALAHRYALVTGSDDFNKPGTQSVFEAYKSGGYKHVEYFEQPGLGHEFPSAEWFRKGIESMDAVLTAEAGQLLATAQVLEKKDKLAEAHAAYAKALAEYGQVAEVAAEAPGKLESLRGAVDAKLTPDLDKLLAAPNADKLRDFAAKWQAFPVADRARAKADELAAKPLDDLLAAKPAPNPEKLAKFATTWQGYPVAERAIAAYDALAATAYTPVEAAEGDKRLKALGKFLEKWTLGPTVERARARRDEDLAAELAAIAALDKPAAKAKRLEAFAKTWKGTAAGAAAEQQLADLIAASQAKP